MTKQELITIANTLMDEAEKLLQMAEAIPEKLSAVRMAIRQLKDKGYTYIECYHFIMSKKPNTNVNRIFYMIQQEYGMVDSEGNVIKEAAQAARDCLTPPQGYEGVQ